MEAVMDRLSRGPAMHVVLNLEKVRHMNSSHIARLLRLRAALINAERQLRLCAVPDLIWGMMITTGLDKVFHFSPDVPSALARLQLEQSA
jgi:anti-anti-sigma factor